jgi:hypothetical protein
MKNILLLLLSLFVVSCSTTSYVREPEPNRINYFSTCPTISTTFIVYTPSPVWHTQYYTNNIYTNHWPYTNNVYSNDYYGYYSNYTHYYLPYNYYTPHYTHWNNHNWNNHYYQYSNGHHREVSSTSVYNTPRQNNSNLSPRPTYYSTPRTNTTQNTNYNTPRTNNNNNTIGVRTISGGRR